jgi:hypothetical protein
MIAGHGVHWEAEAVGPLLEASLGYVETIIWALEVLIAAGFVVSWLFTWTKAEYVLHIYNIIYIYI